MSAGTATLEESLEVQITRLVESDGVLTALRAQSALTRAAARTPPEEADRLLRGVVDGYHEDPLAAYVAIHAASAVDSPAINEWLTRLVAGTEPGLREHAAWALHRRPAVHSAVPSLIAMAGDGGFDRMMAELTLETWLRSDSSLRSWFQRTGGRLQALATPPPPAPRWRRASAGLRVAQVLMQGRVDGNLSSAGSGDTGGLATLQVGLTSALAAQPLVADAYLITRRIDNERLGLRPSKERLGSGATLARLAVGPDRYIPNHDLWEWRFDVERALRRFLIEEGPFDALHLRFADVGTFAAARAGSELGIPVFFTLAPDPHAVIASAEERGQLTRSNFAGLDREQHFLFRARIVEWMLDQAERLAVLPRHRRAMRLEELLGVDIEARPERFRPIAEGINVDLVTRAADAVLDSSRRSDVLVDLDRAMTELPSERRGRPLMVSVGRLHPVKGVDRTVRAWLDDPELHATYNLLVVGGNLSAPDGSERKVLDTIDACLAGRNPADVGLIMLGNRAHAEVAVLLAAAHRGSSDLVGPGGMFVCASEKEEFGLAILEGLAAGLPVVAPREGGPGTYIEHRITGYLADTTSIGDLQQGMRWADGVRLSEHRSRVARRTVTSRFSIDTMARQLVDLYMPDNAHPAAS